MFKAIYRFFSWLAVTKWWPFWSNIRFKNTVRSNIPVLAADRVSTLSDIQQLANKVWDVFSYKKDGFNQLWDAITPPPQNYLYYQAGLVQDDCDGFHSTMYHCLINSGIQCYLLSANSLSGGHCLLVFCLNEHWHILDYTKIYGSWLILDNAVAHYNIVYKEKYSCKHDVWYNALISYDYTTRRFIGLPIKKAKTEVIK